MAAHYWWAMFDFDPHIKNSLYLCNQTNISFKHVYQNHIVNALFDFII